MDDTKRPLGVKEVVEIYVDYLKINTKSADLTVNKYKNIVRRYLIDSLVKYDDVKAMNEWLTQKNKDKSTYAYKYALRHLLMAFGKNEDADEHMAIARKMPRKKVFHYVPKTTVKNIINALPGELKKLAWIQVKMGARFREAATLRVENMDFKKHDQLIYIYIGVNKSQAKGSKRRSLRVSQKYAPMLRSWIKRPFGYLFLDPKYENVTPKELNTHLESLNRKFDEELERVGRAFGVEALSSHYLRHIFADYFIESGGDPVYLQEVFQHAKIETTMGYVSTASKKADEALLRMEEY
jgi:integrase